MIIGKLDLAMEKPHRCDKQHPPLPKTVKNIKFEFLSEEKKINLLSFKKVIPIISVECKTHLQVLMHLPGKMAPMKMLSVFGNVISFMTSLAAYLRLFTTLRSSVR